MYVTSIEIENIRCNHQLIWSVEQEEAAGWHVVLGVNGTGKSSLLSTVALTLSGPHESMVLRQDYNRWLSTGQDQGKCNLSLSWDPAWDTFSQRGKTPKQHAVLRAGLNFSRDNGRVVVCSQDHNPDGARHLWGPGAGWFSASFGPFRRFTGGSREYEKLFYQYPRLAPHLSIFGEEVALTESLAWMKDLHHKMLDYRSRGKTAEGEAIYRFTEGIKHFVNASGFLPDHTRLHAITADDVEFVDGNGCTVPVVDLSDGYRSILSLAFELFRQLARCYGMQQLFDPVDGSVVQVPGVVLIDEIDVHLHPSWQQKVGSWFREHFPRIQFLVTTHSSFVCQAATTIWRMPSPGSRTEIRRLAGDELDSLLYGNVLDAHSTGLFAEGNTRSPAATEKLERFAQLNIKAFDQELSQAEQAERETYRRIFATTPNPVAAS